MDNISSVEKIIGEEDPCFGFTDPLAWADMVEKTFKEKTDYDIDVNQKKVFRVRFTGLKKSEAIKACQKLMARNELCEIVDIEQ